MGWNDHTHVLKKMRASSASRPVGNAGKVFDVKVEGIAEFEKVLKELPEEIQKTVIKNAFKAGADVIRTRAEELAPRGKAENKGKRLHQSIVVELASRRMRDAARDLIMRVSAKHPLAYIIEFGTALRYTRKGKFLGKVSPRSFMRRAVDEKGEAALTAIATAMAFLIDKVAANAWARHAKKKKKDRWL